MKRTDLYYETVKEYRTKLEEIWQSYNKNAEKISSYAGSSGYEKDIQELKSKREKSINELQTEYRSKFNHLISDMTEAATNKNLIAPSSDELTILQVLKMRDKLSKTELLQAAKTLSKNRLALSVLTEVAEKQGYHNLPLGLSTEGILSAIDGLADSAKRLCALRKTNSRGEQAAKASMYHPEHIAGTTNLYSFRIDKDFENKTECFLTMGGINSGDLSTFAEVVD